MSKVSPEYLAARRAQIIETARELFSRKGLSDTSMSDLVEASGMSIGAIYRYFASKDELVAAVAEGRDGTVGGDFPAAVTLLNRIRMVSSTARSGIGKPSFIARSLRPLKKTIARSL